MSKQEKYSNRGKYRIYWVKNGVWEHFEVNGGLNAETVFESILCRNVRDDNAERDLCKTHIQKVQSRRNEQLNAIDKGVLK